MNASKAMGRLREVWRPMLLFYVIAIACRAISVCVLPAFYPDCRQSVALQLCEGWGPALGALAVMCFFKKKLYCNAEQRHNNHASCTFNSGMVCHLVLSD